MKPDAFKATKTGQVIAVNAPGVTHAFIPDPLPAQWRWPQKLWPLLLKARTALAKLDGLGRHLPDPSLLLRPLQHREAQKSSSLEGTVTDPRQQLLYELDPSLQQSDDIEAFKEIYNYAQALRMRRAKADASPLSLGFIRRLHEVLLHNVRGGAKAPGEFRRFQIQIGRPARFVPPPAHLLPDALDHLEKYLHAEKTLDPLVEAFLVHYQFEAIHPFMDGNGRVGRLLLAITIEEWLGLSAQWLYMSAYFDRHKDRYIDLLFRISAEGAWEEWVEFCLTGVVEESEDTMRRCEKLISLQHQYRGRVSGISGASIRLAHIVDSLFEHPVVVPTKLVPKLNITYPTARSDLKKLEACGILAELPSAQQITYYAQEIVETIYGD